VGIAQFGIVAEHAGQVMHHHRPDWFVRMRAGKHQDIARTGPDGQHPDRCTKLRTADPFQDGEVRMLPCQALKILIQFVNGQEPIHLRHGGGISSNIQVDPPGGSCVECPWQLRATVTRNPVRFKMIVSPFPDTPEGVFRYRSWWRMRQC